MSELIDSLLCAAIMIVLVIALYGVMAIALPDAMWGAR